ncbi:MAG: NUDIX hydrolase [Chloroflexi bacterium]|nr:NUDIX hydrolase [Chloroflexota bacterium]
MNYLDKDITFQKNGARFSFRAAGVALNEGRALLQMSELDPFWVLPGGRVEMPESAEDALKREMREELHVKIEVERLLWTLENFFVYRSEPNREIGLYFLMSLPQNSDLCNADGVAQAEDERGMKLWNRWQSLDSLRELDIKPAFLYDVLPAIPNVPNYIVHRDNA